MKKNHDLSTRCVHAGEVRDAEGSPHADLQHHDLRIPLDSRSSRRGGRETPGEPLHPVRHEPDDPERGGQAREPGKRGVGPCVRLGHGGGSGALFHPWTEGIVCLGNAYGGTLALLTDQLPLVGIPTFLLLGGEVGKLEEVLKQGPGLVFFETPTNPTMEIFDIREICRLSHSYGALVAVDNTFASPVNQQVLALGADIAVHSATKYLGGHSDLTGGALMGPKELYRTGCALAEEPGTDDGSGSRRTSVEEPADAPHSRGETEQDRTGRCGSDEKPSEGRQGPVSGAAGFPAARSGEIPDVGVRRDADPGDQRVG